MTTLMDKQKLPSYDEANGFFFLRFFSDYLGYIFRWHTCSAFVPHTE